jgi:BON domain
MAILDQVEALIQRDILEEFAWNPEVEVSRVGVSVVDGIATLTGMVESYPRKQAAERAALRIQGVRAVANDLIVEPGGIDPRSDMDLVRDAAVAIEARRVVPPGEIRSVLPVSDFAWRLSPLLTIPPSGLRPLSPLE